MIGLLCTSDQLVAEAAACITQTQETSIDELSGIQICYPSTRAAADLRPEPHGHQDCYHVHLGPMKISEQKILL
jgi:hypothetical protein